MNLIARILFSLAAFTIALTLSPSESKAQVIASCLGCNVVDTGEFGEGLIGTTVEGDSWGDLYVLNIDWSTYEVYAENDYGEANWYSAYDLYSQTEMSERNGAKVVGGAAVAIALVCILGGCSGSESSASSGSGYGQSRASCEADCYKNSGDPDPIQESANRAACIRQCN